ncbi:MAG: hypothetical protein QQN46_09290, partial [Nitrosopumilus sp.]
CGDGTTLNETNNVCEADPQQSQCGDGTTLNETTNVCEADVTQNDLNLLQNIIDGLNALIAELEALLGGEDAFTEDECLKFQELADKRIANGKDVPRGIDQNVQTCIELGHLP